MKLPYQLLVYPYSNLKINITDAITEAPGHARAHTHTHTRAHTHTHTRARKHKLSATTMGCSCVQPVYLNIDLLPAKGQFN